MIWKIKWLQFVVPICPGNCWSRQKLLTMAKPAQVYIQMIFADIFMKIFNGTDELWDGLNNTAEC